MLDRKFLNKIKRANNSRFNRHCLALLRQVKAPRPPDQLHALSLLIWALEKQLLLPANEFLEDHLNYLLAQDPGEVNQYLELDDLTPQEKPLEQARALLEELNSAMSESLADYPPGKLQNYR